MRIISPIKSLKAAAAIAAGALIPLSFAPYDKLIFSFIGLSIFAWLMLQPIKKSELFLTAFLFALGLFGVGISWIYVSINDYGGMPPIFAFALMAIFVAFLAVIFALPWALLKCIPRSPIIKIFCFAAMWLLVEWIRGWFLTGFPWLYIGHAHLHSPLAGLAPIVGALGIGFVQAAICATLALSIADLGKTSSLRTACLVAIILFAASPLLIPIQWTEPLEPLEVTLIQPNIPLEDKWNPALRQLNIQKLIDLSEGHWDSDILVWPEAALPLATLGEEPMLAELSGLIAPESSLVTGRLVYDPYEQRYTNNLISLGNGSGEYSKRRLVPFGEYVPLEDQLRGLINFFNLPMSVISQGDTDQSLLNAGPIKIAVAICYEIAYAGPVAADSGEANIITTVSNDTWFGNSIGPHQHFQLARMRALENSKPVIRSTNNGITGLIDHHGQVIATTEQFAARALTDIIEPQSGSTFFSRWGHWPTVILSLMIIAISLVSKNREQLKSRLAQILLKNQSQP